MLSPPAPQRADEPPADDKQARATTVRLLKALAAAAVLVPLLLFAFASTLAYRANQALAHERIERSLDVMQEQALKVFQSMNLALDTIDAMLAHRSAAELETDEAQMRERLLQIQKSLPEVQSIWIFGADGHPAVITREFHAPHGEDYSSEDYFTQPRAHPSEIYVGGIHSSVSGGQPYFTYNRAWYDAGGGFAGVIEMSLVPSDFSRFYAHLVTGNGVRFGMVRADGTILARYPQLPRDLQLPDTSAFERAIAANPGAGFYTSTSAIDGTKRLIGIRRLPGLPLYVTAAIETAQIQSDWINAIAVHLIFGLPATALLFASVLIVLRRTVRLHAEQDRRETAEIAARQSQRLDAVGQLTGGVAHDFNNLLTIILGNLGMAQRQLESWTDGAQVKLAQRINNALHGAQRAATLTKRLLAFSRLQPLNPTRLDVNRLINGLSDFLRRTLGEEVSLEIVGSGGLWPVEADAAELESAILNLAVNARDAMPSGGRLTIEASNTYLDDAYCRQNAEVRPGQYVQIAVTDTGTGMPHGVRERAFEPFFTTKPSGQGTGLGLSQVYGFVKQSGGHVKIYSEPGEGTTVRIYLPRLVGGEAAAEPVRAEPSRARAGECVLVVEDDPEVRSYVVEALRDLGYEVIEAAGGGAALRQLNEHKNVRVLLTDVVMPGINGRKLADEAKLRQPSLKVLFMTGYSRNAIVHQGRLDPGVELIQKPVTAEQLAAAVRRVLDSEA